MKRFAISSFLLLFAAGVVAPAATANMSPDANGDDNVSIQELRLHNLDERQA